MSSKKPSGGDHLQDDTAKPAAGGDCARFEEMAAILQGRRPVLMIARWDETLSPKRGNVF